MSRINFDILAADYPWLDVAWSGLRPWFAHNAEKRHYVEESLLAKQVKSVDPETLAVALNVMVEREMLDRKIKVKGPSGILLEGEFPLHAKLPVRFQDRYHTHTYDLDECEPVTGYSWEGADAAPEKA